MERSPALDLLDPLGADATHMDAEACFREAGWDPCGAGDWAIILASPTADLVVRISPFDPVGPYTARLYREAASTGQVPALHAHRRLTGGGDLQLLARLVPVEEAEALQLLDRFAVPTAEFSALAEIVGWIHADALRELPWCVPLDGNPSNVMRTLEGLLVLTEPYYADGPSLYATAERDPALRSRSDVPRLRLHSSSVRTRATSCVGFTKRSAMISVTSISAVYTNAMAETRGRGSEPPAEVIARKIETTSVSVPGPETR